MHKTKHILRVAVLYVATFMLVGAAPMTAYAETGQKEPPETYYYDEATGRWNSNKWVYDKATNTYVPAPVAKPAPPPAPAPTETEKSSGTGGSATENAVAAPGGGTNSIDKTLDANGNTTVGNDLTVENGLESHATTGKAGVTQNTGAGGATSGDAAADATVINAVHSTVQGDTAGIAHFTADINGDVHGDIMLYPAIDGATASSTTKINSNTDIENNTNLTNDLNLSATSGDADVIQNTAAGDATSGNATTVANVINLINTIIAANKSFVGTINIYGNLDGDILISPEFIPQLLASNASIANSVDTSLSASLSDNQQIINNIKLSAETGQANVGDNTSAGSAMTGEALTNLTVLNLTGREVDASNSLLVFVNVMGTWVGMIVDAPGATAAMIGNGVIENKTTINGDLTAANNASITNNITLASKTGDANVLENTQAGNAKTGNAMASANIANISTTKFKLSDWFGVLFINVYGKWTGSFGVNTDAGNIVALAGDAAPPPQGTSLGGPSLRFGFVPHSSNSANAVNYQPLGADVAEPPADTPQITPAEAQLIEQHIEKASDATKDEKSSPNDMTNTVMMAVGSIIALAGATTAATGNGRFFGRRKE